jgi:hypothetical protein
VAQKHEGAQRPQDKGRGNKYNEQLFMDQRTIEEIDNDDAHPIEGVEQDDPPQSDFQQFEQGSVQESHDVIEHLFAMGQAVDNPNVQGKVKDQSQAGQPVQNPGPGPDKIVISEIVKTRSFIQAFPP